MRAVSSAPLLQSALREATRLACECSITPSSMIFSALAASVLPAVVMSTMSSAVPAAGAPSVAPRLLDDAIIGNAVFRRRSRARDPRISSPHASCGYGACGRRSRRRRDRPRCAHRSRPAAQRPRHWHSRSAGRRAGSPRASASGIISRTRSSPVTPRCAAPCASCDDFTRGQIGNLDAVHALDGAAIVAHAARLDQAQACACEEALGVFLQTSLGRDGDDERRGHARASCKRRACQPFDPDREADSGNRRGRPEPRHQIIVSSTGDQRFGRCAVGEFEHDAGVIIHAASESRREGNAVEIDAAFGEFGVARVEQVERRRQHQVRRRWRAGASPPTPRGDCRRRRENAPPARA